ncbi:hypothetical protein GUJ93_ZPchr0009g1050 [Zizania palustris]|uniref:DUF834 domain-containing protein n=1 Tax=Zizania palustris TaxID=103762 RepID=A0A8J5RXA8_ZIZPA|nr:hypothetical protein GUJ93_ZPchr0009g1050 [Zizania palustris]
MRALTRCSGSALGDWEVEDVVADGDPKPRRATATPSPADATSRRSEEICVGETTPRQLAVVGGAAVSGAAVKCEAAARLEKWSLREKG